MDIKKQFGLTIRRLRTSSNNEGVKISQQDIADEAGISRRQYVKLENGESMPTLDTMIKLSKAFDMKFSDFSKCFESSFE